MTNYERNPFSSASAEPSRELHHAALAGDATLVRQLIASGASVGCVAKFGGSPLHWAAPLGDMEICRMLLAAGDDPNGRDGTGRTPLINASATGSYEICALLITNGGDVNRQDDAGRSPLQEAALRIDEKICLLLIDSGADIRLADKEKFTPAHSAVLDSSAGLCRLFEERWPGISNLSIDGGYTPFQYAVAQGKKDVVKFFMLECRADLAHVERAGQTLEIMAAGNRSMQELLRALKAELSVRDAMAVDEAAAQPRVRLSLAL
jgi:ankyrin repeat protein